MKSSTPTGELEISVALPVLVMEGQRHMDELPSLPADDLDGNARLAPQTSQCHGTCTPYPTRRSRALRRAKGAQSLLEIRVYLCIPSNHR